MCSASHVDNAAATFLQPFDGRRRSVVMAQIALILCSSSAKRLTARVVYSQTLVSELERAPKGA